MLQWLTGIPLLLLTTVLSYGTVVLLAVCAVAEYDAVRWGLFGVLVASLALPSLLVPLTVTATGSASGGGCKAVWASRVEALPAPVRRLLDVLQLTLLLDTAASTLGSSEHAKAGKNAHADTKLLADLLRSAPAAAALFYALASGGPSAVADEPIAWAAATTALLSLGASLTQHTMRRHASFVAARGVTRRCALAPSPGTE